MTGSERDLIGEYVLGTLEADEKRSFDAALARDRELAAAVERFASRIQALDDTVPAKPIPSAMWSSIEARLSAPPPAPQRNDRP